MQNWHFRLEAAARKLPFVVHKITIDYAFDQVFKPKMLSLHENITPQILTFMHELPFFPSYFVWNPFCFCRGFVLFLPWNPFCFYRGYLSVFAVDLFLLWMPLCIFLLPFCFSLSFLLLSPTKSEKRGRFFGKSPSYF